MVIPIFRSNFSPRSQSLFPDWFVALFCLWRIILKAQEIMAMQK